MERARYTLRRTRLADGEETTTYAVRHPLAGLRAGVHVFRQARRLDLWCAKRGVHEAIVGGFYMRDPFRPLGEVRRAGESLPGTPFDARWRAVRPALHLGEGPPVIARRGELPADPEGDLLQAGPLLVDGGRVVYRDGADVEGFTAGSAQFDSDITDGRYPRAAVGLDDRCLVVLACDGRRSRMDAGLTMLELAELMRAVGCRVAMNLDGGGSTTLVHRGHLLNRPYSAQDQPAPASRPIVSALLLS